MDLKITSYTKGEVNHFYFYVWLDQQFVLE
jgi:hypothetical protein